MNLIALLGFLAAAGTTISFVPQVIKSCKTRKTADISLVMYILMSAGNGLWLIYGILIHSLPLLLANAVTLTLNISILFLKIKYK